MNAIILPFPLKPRLTPMQRDCLRAYERGMDVAHLDYDLQSFPGVVQHWRTYKLKTTDECKAFDKGYLKGLKDIRDGLSSDGVA